jgi:hypothetical protein
VVDKSSYNVLLDYPDENKFNSIEIKNSQNQTDRFFEIKEPVLDRNNNSNISKPFLAYSKNGSKTFVKF